MSPKDLPKLVVFDLDCTLWPFWVDNHVLPPFVKTNGFVYDSRGSMVPCYPEATEVLEHVESLGCDMAVASRAADLKGANQLIELFGWDRFFKYKEIYPGCKKTHFQRIKESSNVNYEDMLFFDDEYPNIIDLKEYNVTSVLLNEGINMNVLKEGLNTYQEEHS